ncbi:unnamed protein product [Effrenium voratum]|uniref:SEC7 domain-containing protein n=1 Tax=Effrenium voratum TaxID=2562239 RepID=A0AA36IYN5_9DINO|nr:unnamed protein product [Effrenium voratum]
MCNDTVCPKTQLQAHGPENELLDDRPACDPAGAVFTETLEELNEVDRLLLLFSASRSNLAGVRWLVRLGANPSSCDTNGTTCLHAACRVGAVAIVAELLAQPGAPKGAVDATDCAGWAPLHVALFMGRRQVSMLLLQQGADPFLRTLRGQTPAELSSDLWLREVVQNYAEHREQRLSHKWQPPAMQAPGDIQVASRLRFEPFFVPRQPVLKDNSTSELQTKLGREIFNHRPGQGLAFVVSSGCIRDFPVELSGFLGQNQVCPARVGEFLGEDYSLSQTLRLEFINSVRLLGTGVASCLAKVFKAIVIPTEMVKIDRLVDGVAQIWWRQHEQLAKKGDQVSMEGPEVQGLQLMKSVGSYDMLHQLMFSAILLHWNLYAPLPQSQRVTLEQWLEISDVEGGATLKHVQSLIYDVISQNFYPQLEIWKPRAPPKLEAQSVPEAEGWGRIVGGFPSLAFASAHRVDNYRHLRSILSEGTATSFLQSPEPSRGEGGAARPAQVPGFGEDDYVHGYQESLVAGPFGGSRVWLALHCGFLFLSPSPEPWAPYAFMHLEGLFAQSDAPSLLLTLLPALLGPVGSPRSSPRPALQVVFLLPDGRWQVIEVPRFQVQLADGEQLESFRQSLMEHCLDESVVSKNASPLRKEIEYATELEKSNGNAASREGDWKKAKRYWKNALRGAEKIQDAETEFRLHSNLALAYTKQKKIEKALEHCDKALKERLKVAVSSELRGKVHYRRAEAFEAAGEVSKAISSCKLSLEVHPEDAAVRKKLSQLKALEADQRKREKALFAGLRGYCGSRKAPKAESSKPADLVEDSSDEERKPEEDDEEVYSAEGAELSPEEQMLLDRGLTDREASSRLVGSLGISAKQGPADPHLVSPANMSVGPEIFWSPEMLKGTKVRQGMAEKCPMLLATFDGADLRVTATRAMGLVTLFEQSLVQMMLGRPKAHMPQGKILSRKKTWELRSRPTNIRGYIGLVQVGTGKLLGKAELVRCIHLGRKANGRWIYRDEGSIRKTHVKHRCKIEDVNAIGYTTLYAWVLRRAVRYKRPRAVNSQEGSVVWTKLR